MGRGGYCGCVTFFPSQEVTFWPILIKHQQIDRCCMDPTNITSLFKNISLKSAALETMLPFIEIIKIV